MSRDGARERQQWAVDLMEVKPKDRILEIGCGAGLAAGIIADHLRGGTLLAVDASAAMIRKAEIRNKDAIDAGRIRFIEGAFADLDWDDQVFDKVFAFNVNVFWMRPDQELSRLRSLLTPRGCLFLFYTPPDKSQLIKIQKQLPAHLHTHHFKVEDRFAAKFGTTLALGVRARTAQN